MVSKYLHELHTHNGHPICLFRKVSRPRFVLNLRLKFTCVTYDPLRSTTDQFESIGYWVTAQLGHQAHKFTSKIDLPSSAQLCVLSILCPFSRFFSIFVFWSDSKNFVLNFELRKVHIPWAMFLKYCKVTSSNTSGLEAHAGFFRLLMKGINPHAMWPFNKKWIF